VTTLLLSDPCGTKSAAAVCFKTGAFKDPDNLPGLAHLCEHSIFLGNKYDPIPYHFFQLINQFNGQTNAYTTGEHTCFQFEIPNADSIIEDESLLSFSLRNFSHLFLNPNFKETDIRKEINAVDDEHLANISKVDKLMYHGLRLLANKMHPFSRFCTGSLTTLDIPDLPKLLSVYFNENYTADNMSLVLISPQSLNQLQKLAVQHFDKIVPSWARLLTFNNKARFSKTKKAFDTKLTNIPSAVDDSKNKRNREINKGAVFVQFNRLLHIRSTTDKIYRFVFAYSTHFPHIDFFERVWCNILGDESKGSITDCLTNQMQLATSVLAHTANLANDSRVLMVDIKPTLQGNRNGTIILETLMNFIFEKVCNESDELKRFIRENQMIIEQNCYYQNPHVSIIDKATIFSETLQSDLYDLKHENILRGFRNFEHEVESSTMSCFVEISNQVFREFNLIYLGDNYLNVERMTSSNTDKLHYDNYYKFQYSTNIMTNIHSNNSISQIPKANVFLTNTKKVDTQFSSSYNSIYQTTNISRMNAPAMIEDSEYVEFWFKKELDIEYSGMITTTFSTKSLALNLTPQNDMAILLICHLLGNNLKTDLYPAELLGYQWGIFANLNGIPCVCLTLNGLKNNYETVFRFIIEQVLQFLTSHSISYREFMDARIYIRRELEKFELTNGLVQSFKGSLVFLEELFWTLDERIAALETLSLSDVQEVANTFATKLRYTSILVTGDCELDQSMNIFNIMNKTIIYQQLDHHSTKLKQPSSHVFPRGKNFIFEAKNLNNSDPMNTIFYYLQIQERNSIKSRFMAPILAYIFSIKVCPELRGKKMLGYAVSSGLRVSRSMIGVYISLMSGKYNSFENWQHIQNYLHELEKDLLNLSEEQFQCNFIDPYIKSKTGFLSTNYFFNLSPCASSSNFDDNNSHLKAHNMAWEKIFNKDYQFQTMNEDTPIKISKQAFMEFFQEYVSVESPKRTSLSIFIDSGLPKVERDQLVALKIRQELERLHLTVPQKILDDILQSSGNEYGAIIKKVEDYYMSTSKLRYVYNTVKMLRLTKRGITSTEKRSLVPEKSSTTGTLSLLPLNSDVVETIMLKSVDQLRELSTACFRGVPYESNAYTCL
jgi:protease AXL1